MNKADWNFIRWMLVAYTLVILMAVFVDLQRRDWGGVVTKLLVWFFCSLSVWWTQRRHR